MENIELLEKNPTQINVGLIPEKKEDENLISDQALLGIYKEILDNVKKDTNQIDEFIDLFAESVVNVGDATTSSKEALVNLLKMKVDQSDKSTKIADLMTRIKLKSADTFPKYLAQNNTVNIDGGNNKRQLLDAINKAKKVEKKKDE